jgi:hypothetical protein
MTLLELVAKTIPQPWLREALRVVGDAASMFMADATRRNWAIERLTSTLHIGEHVARLLLELAVAARKNDVRDLGTPEAPAKH